MDDGLAGDFKQVAPPSMKLEHSIPVERGLTYRLRYRAKNSIGWGDRSDVLNALAAEPPARPSAPTVVSASGAAVDLAFEESHDDGGARITAYELWVSSDYQAASPTYSQIVGYSDNQMGYTVTSSDGLVPGSFYSFRLRVVNTKGASEFSEELIVAAAEPVA